MAQRKYTKSGEKPQGFQCCKCKWEGNDEDKISVTIDSEIEMSELQCPICGHNEFYGLLKKVEINKSSLITTMKNMISKAKELQVAIDDMSKYDSYIEENAIELQKDPEIKALLDELDDFELNFN